MSEAKELARAIAFELSEHFLEIAGDDYRELFLERKIHLAAINELEKQLGEANARIAELEAEVEELKPYRDGYDANEILPEEGENVFAETQNEMFLAQCRGGAWYYSFGDKSKVINKVKRWWKLPDM